MSAPDKLSANYTDEIVPWNVKTLPRTDIERDPQIPSTMTEKAGLQSQMMKPSGQLLWFSQCITEKQQRETTNDTVVNVEKSNTKNKEGILQHFALLVMTDILAEESCHFRENSL